MFVGLLFFFLLLHFSPLTFPIHSSLSYDVNEYSITTTKMEALCVELIRITYFSIPISCLLIPYLLFFAIQPYYRCAFPVNSDVQLLHCHCIYLNIYIYICKPGMFVCHYCYLCLFFCLVLCRSSSCTAPFHHPALKSRDYARRKCKYHMCSSGFPHALREMDAELRRPDT